MRAYPRAGWPWNSPNGDGHFRLELFMMLNLSEILALTTASAN